MTRLNENLVGFPYGGVAQLARAFGSYPKCQRFKSVRRYHVGAKFALLRFAFHAKLRPLPCSSFSPQSLTGLCGGPGKRANCAPLTIPRPLCGRGIFRTAPLLLLLRKKSRSRRLSPCKRGLLTPACSLPTFCGGRLRRLEGGRGKVYGAGERANCAPLIIPNR
jgi:hypothetical protein